MTGMELLAGTAVSGIDVSPHAAQVTRLLFVVVFLALAFFVFRPELWRKIFLHRVDPRPAGLLRIFLGIAVLWTFIDLLPMARFLFTDEGLWLTDMARYKYGGGLRRLWDPEQGFEHWWNYLTILWGKFTILHFRSDPPFVFALYGLMMISNLLMIVGLWTRWTTIATWLLVVQIYGYSRVFFIGGDLVLLSFLFMGIFTRWGEAYSADSWRRRRRAILGGATAIPPLRKIPPWPLCLTILQLAIIYCATGLLKSGPAWTSEFSALYYALNLDAFYRVYMTPAVAWAQYLGILPVMTWMVRWWEILFPLALVGMLINNYERERAAGTWVGAPQWRKFLSWLCVAAAWIIAAYVTGVAARYYASPEAALPVTLTMLLIPPVAIASYLGARSYLPRVFDFTRKWLLGKRLWLTFGVAMHVGIDLTMNIGTFSEITMSGYLAWLAGRDIDGLWRFLFSRPLEPGEASRPARDRAWKGLLLAPFDRLRHRAPGRAYVVCHHPDEASVRRAALLRPWDLGGRLRFVARKSVPRESLQLEIEGGQPIDGKRAGKALTSIFPGLWWLWPARLVPGLGNASGGLANRILGQR